MPVHLKARTVITTILLWHDPQAAVIAEELLRAPDTPAPTLPDDYDDDEDCVASAAASAGAASAAVAAALAAAGPAPDPAQAGRCVRMLGMLMCDHLRAAVVGS